MIKGVMSGKASGWIFNVAFTVFAVVLAIVLARAGLGFGQQLLAAGLLIVAGSQLSRLTSRLLPHFHWPVLAKGVGWVFLVAVLVNSSLVQKPLEWLDSVEAGVAGGTFSLGSGCPGTQTVEEYGETFTLKRGCGEHLLRVPRNMDPWYHPRAGAGYWVNANWDKHDATLIRLNPRWPEGIDVVEVEAITAAEAARRKRLAGPGR